VLAGWQRIPGTFSEIGLDACIVMPDHVHGVLFTGTDPEAGGEPPTVGDVVRWFKSVTVRAYGDGVKAHGWEPYERHLWQGKFHDRIVRSDGELKAVRAYIEGNPGRWWERQEAVRAETRHLRADT
jgi:REP element-mobilizing transposase RayT